MRLLRYFIILVFSFNLLFSDCHETYKGKLFETVTSSKRACKNIDENATYYYISSRHYCCFVRDIKPYFGVLKTSYDLGMSFTQTLFIYSLIALSFAFLLVRFLWGFV